MSALTIIGINYPPERTGIAPYTAALAERAATLGHRVTVLTGLPSYPRWRVAPAYRRLYGRERWGNVEVLRSGHFVPRRQSALLRAAYEGSFLLTSSLALPFTRRPDAVIGVVPALADGIASALAARVYGVPYALLFQDLMGPAAAQSGIQGGGVVAHTTAMVEGRLARGAAAVGIVSAAFESYLTDAGVDAHRIVHVPNWTRLAPGRPLPDVRARFGWQREEVIVLHGGNIGLKQGLEQVVDAARLAAAERPGYRFVFVGDGNQRPGLEAATASLPNVTFLGMQPDDVYAALLAAADVLLLSERASTVDMSLPSKLTSYFASGSPVLAAVRHDGATASEIRSAKAGVIVDAGNPNALVAAIDRLIADSGLRTSVVAAARRHVATTLGEDLALRRLDSLLERVLGSGRPAVMAA